MYITDLYINVGVMDMVEVALLNGPDSGQQQKDGEKKPGSAIKIVGQSSDLLCHLGKRCIDIDTTQFYILETLAEKNTRI